MARGFRVVDPNGEVLFAATKGMVQVGADSLSVTGSAKFDGSVQTPLVRAEAGKELK